MRATILRSGFQSSVQDLGRTGHRASGVSLGGALDSYALAVANLVAGNDFAAAGLEVSLGQLRIVFDDDRLVAWAGGAFRVCAGGEEIHAGHAARVQAGETVEMIAPPNGARAWLAVSGGIDVPLVLGSRATDLRNGFGGLEGRALRDGDRLALGPPLSSAGRIAEKIGDARMTAWRAPWDWASTKPIHPFLRIVRGADWSDFESAMVADKSFRVAAALDRMGVRLEGEALVRQAGGELSSEAVAPGTIQVPPDGRPIILLGDCQTIGGYPKLAHVITIDLPAAAQLRPGDEVRFAEVTHEAAQRLLLERAHDFEKFRLGLELHLS